MGFFDLIFSTTPRYPHVIVYSETIERIPALRFNREITVTRDGEKQTIDGQETKDMLKSFVHGGLSLNLLHDKLKSIGLKDSQLEKRKWLMDMIAVAALPPEPEENRDEGKSNFYI